MAIRLDHGEEQLAEVHEINVTPFIDVVLVLLIIFMVAAPLATVDVAVDLPSSTVQPQQRPDKPVYLTLKPDLTLTLGDSEVSRDGLATALAAATKGNKDERIYLRGDRAVAYGEVMQVMNDLRSAGYLKVALVGSKSRQQMTTLALDWFGEEDPRDLKRWGLAAAIVLGTHVVVIAGFLLIRPADELDAGAPVAFVELAPIDNTAGADQSDVAPAPEAALESKPIEPEKPPEEKFEPAPPPEVAPTIVPDEVEKPQEKVEPEVTPPAPQTTAPAQVQRSGRTIAPAWRDRLIAHLQRFKRYPSSAESRGEQGVVVLSFSMDRTGHVLSRHVSRSSGYAQLDEEVVSMIDRAQPLPPFPATMVQGRIDLTVPIRFSIR